jgi:DNA-binding transcriptional ArsR family regulator
MEPVVQPVNRHQQRMAEYHRKRAAPQQKPQNSSVKPKRHSYGRFEVLNNFVDEWASEFSPAVRAVWLHLFRHTNGKTQICDITCRQIAQKSKLSKTTVSKALGELEKKGLLIYIFRSVMNSGKPSLVRLEPRSRPVPLSGQDSTTQ